MSKRHLQAALAYAQRGWPVFPLHAIHRGRCTCGRDCGSLGKPPLVRRGLHEATTDVDQVATWWSRIDVAEQGARRAAASGDDALFTVGNETLLRVRDRAVVAAYDYAPEDTQEMALDDFLELLAEWRRRVMANAEKATGPLSETYRRNPLTGSPRPTPGAEPTTKQKFRYYFLGLTPPVELRSWVERDVASTWWKIRQAFFLLLGFCIGLGLLTWVADPGWASVVGVLIGAIIGTVFQLTVMADYVRKRTLNHYDKKWARQR